MHTVQKMGSARGSLLQDADCNAEGNDYNHIQCVGSGVCNFDGAAIGGTCDGHVIVAKLSLPPHPENDPVRLSIADWRSRTDRRVRH